MKKTDHKSLAKIRSFWIYLVLSVKPDGSLIVASVKMTQKDNMKNRGNKINISWQTFSYVDHSEAIQHNTELSKTKFI